jgi:hypothetical protein
VAREPGQVGDARVGDDQRPLVAVHQPGQRVRDRRQPAAAVDQDRHLPVGRQLEDRREAIVVEQELLRPRMELDPARAEVEAAHRLLDRPLAEVEPDEGGEPALRRLRVSERAVVGGPERRMAVALVEAEDDRAHDARALLHARELVGVADHAVDVVAEVRVDVDELGALGQLGAHDGLERLEQRLGSSEDVVHLAESTDRPRVADAR